MATKKQPLRKKTSRKTRLEKQYEKLFVPIIKWPHSSDSSSLVQPSPQEDVFSVVTYGAYEQPIVG